MLFENMRRHYFYSGAFLLLFFGTFVMAFGQGTRSGPKIRTIIVDAGHGGTDVGARGKYSTEAEITLKLSLKLDELLRKELPDTRIVMTRKTDIFHNVREKAKIANDQDGDLFVCIHVNAAPDKKHKELLRYKTVTYYKGKGKSRKKYTRKEPVYRYWTTPNPMHGTSTYVFAADRADEKASVLLTEERYESAAETVDVPDPKSTEAIIAARLWSQKFFKNSVRLGTMIEDEFVKIGRSSQGVLQRNHKGIWVLQATNMPAVLIETGFITDKEEEDYLNSEEGQQEMVRAIANGVLKYKQQLESRQTTRADSSSTSKKSTTPPPAPEKQKSTQKPIAIMPASTKRN
jgi:N-acetylmuramoyl-L-alanine amidase